MRWKISAIALILPLLGHAQAAPKDVAKTLDSAAARDEAQAQIVRQRALVAQSQRQDAALAAAYAASLREKQQNRAFGAKILTQRALAGVGPAGGDAKGASARAALAAHANEARLQAEQAAGAIGKSESEFKVREQGIAALIASLDGAAAAFEARASAQRAAAEAARSAEAARLKRLALAAKQSKTKRPSKVSPSAKAIPAAQVLPKSAATQRLIEGGGSIVRGFGQQRAGGPPAAGVTMVPSRSGGLVMVPLGGIVMHVGPLRHLGMVLIMDAGDGYVLVFGGLADVALPTGARLSKGDRIGHLPQAAESALYFEVRHNGISIDPESWAKLRS